MTRASTVVAIAAVVVAFLVLVTIDLGGVDEAAYHTRTFMGADDVWDPRFLAATRELLAANERLKELDAGYGDFLEMQTVGSLQSALAAAIHRVFWVGAALAALAAREALRASCPHAHFAGQRHGEQQHEPAHHRRPVQAEERPPTAEERHPDEQQDAQHGTQGVRAGRPDELLRSRVHAARDRASVSSARRAAMRRAAGGAGGDSPSAPPRGVR